MGHDNRAHGGVGPDGNGDQVPVPLYDEEFARDPHRVYDRLRRQGPIARVELAPGVPASLIVNYSTALEMLVSESGDFTRDPSVWQRTVPPECPVLPQLMYRRCAVFVDGAEHERLRRPVADSLARVDQHEVRELVAHSADILIHHIGHQGQADLHSDYARALPVLVFNELFGCPPALSQRFINALEGIWDASVSNVAYADLWACVQELIQLKRAQPGQDLVSRLATHPEQLDDEELIHELLMLVATGVTPNVNLIGNALRLLLTESRFANVTTGSLLVDNAIDEAMWQDPPLHNYSVNYPIRDVVLAGVHLPAHQPVLVGYAAANTDPQLDTGSRTGNKSHLSWGAGPHMCPGRDLARIMAQGAIEAVLDQLPDMELAVPSDQLTWDLGPFNRALTALPVRFSPLPAPATPMSTGDFAGAHDPFPMSTARGGTSTAKTGKAENAVGRRWWHSLVRFLRG